MYGTNGRAKSVGGKAGRHREADSVRVCRCGVFKQEAGFAPTSCVSPGSGDLRRDSKGERGITANHL